MYNQNASCGYTPSLCSTMSYAPDGQRGAVYASPSWQHYLQTPQPEIFSRTTAPYGSELYLSRNLSVDHDAVHATFLSPTRPETSIVGTTKEVERFIHAAFKKITGEQFPDNITITVCTKEELKRKHRGAWSDGIQGFSLNRQGSGINEIFVKQNYLDQLMLTIGHEIGHVMSPTLPDARDEEAKAFAFELTWIDTLIDHNIAGLANAFHAPATNGLHDVAFSFVQQLLKEGQTALAIFSNLVLGRQSINNRLETIVVS